MKRKYTKAKKEEVLAWRLATGSTMKETGEHFDIPASTIGSWSSKIQVNIGQVEPEIAVDEQPLGGEGVFEDGDQVTHDMTYRFVNNRKIYLLTLTTMHYSISSFPPIRRKYLFKTKTS